MPSVQNTNTSPRVQRDRDLVVSDAGERPERHARQLDLSALAVRAVASGYGSPELDSVTARRLKSKNA